MGTEKALILAITVIIVSGIGSCTHYNEQYNTKVVEAIKISNSPIEAMCALNTYARGSAECVLIATKLKGEKL